MSLLNEGYSGYRPVDVWEEQLALSKDRLDGLEGSYKSDPYIDNAKVILRRGIGHNTLRIAGIEETDIITIDPPGYLDEFDVYTLPPAAVPETAEQPVRIAS